MLSIPAFEFLLEDVHFLYIFLISFFPIFFSDNKVFHPQQFRISCKQIGKKL